MQITNYKLQITKYFIIIIILKIEFYYDKNTYIYILVSHGNINVNSRINIRF